MRIVIGMRGFRIVPRSRGVWGTLALLALLAAGLGATTAYFVRLDMPSLHALEEYAPPQMTRILGRDGSEIASFAAEKRTLLGSHDIPKSFRDALIASEDSRFEQHAGIDPIGGVRALLSDVRRRAITEGASTLTMQLAGMLFLDRSQRTVRRKLQEIFLALEIERRFTKEEIVRTYCNQVHFGHGLYGLEAAAQYFFDKPARELTIGESATLVGVLPRPASYSPHRNMARATQRRNLVLRRMVDEGYLDPTEAQRIKSEPIVVSSRGEGLEIASHFNEEVRRWLQENYGTNELYRGGMKVNTTLDRRLQKLANRAVDAGLRALDKRQGWRPEAPRRVPEGQELESWTAPAWAGAIELGRITDGIVLSVDADRATVRVDEQTGSLTAEEIGWTGESRPDRLLRRGQVIRVRPVARDDEGRLRLTLEQEPQVEGALVAIDPGTGEILALVGGFDFARSEYDRATQARRQTGSLFKPFVFAAALSRGFTLADTLLDEPTVFLDRRRPVPYQPENFSREYYETITLRTALEKSANIGTVRLLARLGYDPVIETARRLGITNRLRPYPSLALGVFELTLLEMTSAYGAFANQGLLMEPHSIKEVTDRQGRVIHLSRPNVSEAVSPQVAYLMNQALSGVMRRGTGRSAGSVLNRTLAGKTGTTDDYTDAWFVGYSPGLVVGVWVGFDEPRKLGEFETGARAALPIWTDFVRRALEGVPDAPFPVPPGISTATIDPSTGRQAEVREGCPRQIEVFIEGTEPTHACSRSLHDMAQLPYPLQRYELDSDGALMIPRNELDRILAGEPDLRYRRRRQLLEAANEDGYLRIRIKLLPPTELPPRPEIDPELDHASWIGTDGRPARVIWIDHGP